MATAYIEKSPDGGRAIASRVIDSYKHAQDQMLRAISAMDELTTSPSPDALRLSHTRLRITRMSQQCRSAFQEVAALLSREGSPAVRGAVEELELAHLELKEATWLHLATWAPSEIGDNWQAYCLASAEVRRRWRQIIERERQLFFPLLMNQWASLRPLPEKRAFERMRATVPAIIQTGDQRYSARVGNIQRSGALLETRARLLVRTSAIFCCGSVAAEMEVAWADQGRLGVSFVRPFSEHELQELLSRSKALAALRG
jgi:hypothetical protein